MSRISRLLESRSVSFIAMTLPLLIGLVVGIAIWHVIGIDPTTDESWQAAATAHEQGYWLDPGQTRSLMPTIIMGAWQRIFGAGSASAWALKSLLYVAAFSLSLLVARQLLAKESLILFAWLSGLAPYGVWCAYVGRDVAFDLVGIALLLLVALRTIHEPLTWWRLGVLGASGALAFLAREPSLFVFLVLVIYWAWIARPRLEHLFPVVLGFCVVLAPLLWRSYALSGELRLVNRTGINLLIGNHPYYLDGHPRWDIDGFLEPRIHADHGATVRGLSASERDQYYTDQAIAAVAADPAAAIYRGLLKALWWVGPLRIPASDQSAYLDPEADIIHVQGSLNTLKELAYVSHRVVILAGLVLCFHYRSIGRRESVFLLLPILAVLPIIIATFPDTRFRIALDPPTYMLAAAGLADFWHRLRLRPDC